MRIFRLSTFLVSIAIAVSNFSLGQQAPQNPGIDPLALDVLRATMDSLHNTKAFSFRALVAKEHLGTNGQIITMFRLSDVTIEQPNRMRVHAQTESGNIDLYYDAGTVTLFAPDQNLYASVTAGATLDKVVDGLEARGVDLPLAPLFRSDPYKTITDGLESAAVIGRVMINGKTFHQLAFTEKDASWQLWVEAGAMPTPRRVEIVYTNLPRQPRVTIDFTNWNLSATPTADFFTFHKAADAKRIDLMKSEERQSK